MCERRLLRVRQAKRCRVVHARGACGVVRRHVRGAQTAVPPALRERLDELGLEPLHALLELGEPGKGALHLLVRHLDARLLRRVRLLQPAVGVRQVAHHPRVLLDALERDALGGVLLQEPVEQVPDEARLDAELRLGHVAARRGGRLRDGVARRRRAVGRRGRPARGPRADAHPVGAHELGQGKVVLRNHGKQGKLGLGAERHVAEQEAVERHAERPDIDGLGDARRTAGPGARHAQLRRKESGAAGGLGELHLVGGGRCGHRRRVAQRGGGALVGEAHVGDAKVGDFDPVVLVPEQVRRLNVPVDDPLVVQVLEAEHKIAQHAARLVDAHRRAAHDVLPDHVAALHELEHHKYLAAVRIVDHLLELHHILVVQLLHHGDLPAHLFVGERRERVGRRAGARHAGERPRAGSTESSAQPAARLALDDLDRHPLARERIARETHPPVHATANLILTAWSAAMPSRRRGHGHNILVDHAPPARLMRLELEPVGLEHRRGVVHRPHGRRTGDRHDRRSTAATTAWRAGKVAPCAPAACHVYATCLPHSAPVPRFRVSALPQIKRNGARCQRTSFTYPQLCTLVDPFVAQFYARCT